MSVYVNFFCSFIISLVVCEIISLDHLPCVLKQPPEQGRCRTYASACFAFFSNSFCFFDRVNLYNTLINLLPVMKQMKTNTVTVYGSNLRSIPQSFEWVSNIYLNVELRTMPLDHFFSIQVLLCSFYIHDSTFRCSITIFNIVYVLNNSI